MNEITYNTDHGEVKLSPEIVRKYLVSGQGNVTNQEIMYFLALCKYQALNPFLREAYLIKYQDDAPATIVVGKDTFTKRAAKDVAYDGAEAGIVIQVDPETTTRRAGTMLFKDEILVGGWAKVYRKDWTHPVEIEVSLIEYMGKKRDGSPNHQWARMPATMIRKVALVQALREAFPDRFQGMYDASEMQQVDGDSLPDKMIEVETDKAPEQTQPPITIDEKTSLDTVANEGWIKADEVRSDSAQSDTNV